MELVDLIKLLREKSDEMKKLSDEHNNHLKIVKCYQAAYFLKAAASVLDKYLDLMHK